MPEVLSRRSWLRAAPVAALALACAVPPALAQDYPTRAVKIVVPFAPGGSADVFGRYTETPVL